MSSNESSLAQQLKDNCIASIQAAPSPLFTAILNGDIEAAKQCTEEVNQPNVHGITPLMAAIALEKISLVQFLIEKGASLQANLFGFTPAHVAVSNGNAPLLTLVLGAGADPNALALNNVTPLYLAASQKNYELIKILLAQPGINPNIGTTLTHETPLLIAAQLGDLEMAKALIKAGADVNAILLPTHFSPLLIAAKEGFLALAKILLEAGADMTITAPNGDTALHLAIAFKRSMTASLLIEKGINLEATVASGETALHLAALTGNTDIVTMLLERHANVHAVNKTGAITPLHAAALHGNAEMVEKLLAAGANINAITEDGETPLVFALYTGQKHDVVQVLLDKGADVSLKREEVLQFAKLSAETGFPQAITQLQTINTKLLEKAQAVHTSFTTEASLVQAPTNDAAEPQEISDIASMAPPELSEGIVTLQEL